MSLTNNLVFMLTPPGQPFVNRPPNSSELHTVTPEAFELQPSYIKDGRCPPSSLCCVGRSDLIMHTTDERGNDWAWA